MKKKCKSTFTEVVKAGLIAILRRVAQVYKRFGRPLRLNLHWSGRDAVRVGEIVTQGALIMKEQHMIEVVFEYKPESQFKTNGAGL